jgi:HAD superfamily hydrolase (TIGR01509 family)
MNYRELYDHLQATYDLAMDRELFIEWYETTAERIYTEDASLLEGAQAMIDELRSAGVTVGLVSSSPPHWIDMVCERFDLDVDEIVSADTIEAPGKPEPDVYEIAADRVGVDPEDCVAVEDSRHGIEAASRAGMHVVGFRHGAADETDRSTADYVADTPADLQAYLRSRLESSA